jgi:hypothetical protein
MKNLFTRTVTNEPCKRLVAKLFRPACCLVGLMCFSASAFAQTGSAASQEPWYKIATGIIAIPAALVGLMFSYRLLRKTNLEARKLELEISEKQQKFQSASENEGLQALKELVEPIGLSQRFPILIIRFIILELTLRLWNFIPFVVNKIFSIATSSLLLIIGPSWFTTESRVSGATVFLIPGIIGIAFDIVYWFIVFGFGWPLLKDAGKVLGISFSGIFDLPFFWKRQRRRGVS